MLAKLSVFALAAFLALPASARDEPVKEGVNVGKTSSFTKLVPAEQVEAGSAQQYQQMLRQAAQQKALAACNDPDPVLPCFVYAINDKVVFSQRRPEPIK